MWPVYISASSLLRTACNTLFAVLWTCSSVMWPARILFFGVWTTSAKPVIRWRHMALYPCALILIDFYCSETQDSHNSVSGRCLCNPNSALGTIAAQGRTELIPIHLLIDIDVCYWRTTTLILYCLKLADEALKLKRNQIGLRNPGKVEKFHDRNARQGARTSQEEVEKWLSVMMKMKMVNWT